MTWRIIRALQVMQWRLVINGLTHSKQRGEMESLSRLTDFILPILMGIILIPLTLAFTAGGGLAGYFLATATRNPQKIAMVLGFGLCLPCAWVLFRPFGMLASRQVERNDLVRLLPIPHWLLRHLELFRALHEPVFLVFVPGLLLLPLGILVGGKPLFALAALVASLLLIAFLACTATLIALAAQLLLRNRRRGEVVGLIFVLIMSMLGILPQFFAHNGRHSRANKPAIERPLPDQVPDGSIPEGSFEELQLPRGVRALPPFLYGEVLCKGAISEWRDTGIALGGLLAISAVMYSLSIPIYRRLTETPAVSSSGNKNETVGDATGNIPFVPAAIAAVAINNFRVLIRTIRGKLAIVSPLIVAVMFTFMARQGGPNGAGFMSNPLMIGGFIVLVGFGNLGIFTVNQFAIMGSGLILEFLQPIAPRTLLRGRMLAATGLFLLGLTPALITLAVLMPSTAPALLPMLFFAGLSVDFLLFPLAALLSMIFPKRADLSSAGRGAQPHAAAGMLHFFAVVPAALPAAGLIALSLLMFHSKALATLLTGGWAVLTFFIALAVIRPLEATLLNRRENLALVAVGR